MTILEFKSPENGSCITFQKIAEYEGDIEFEMNVRTANFTGCARATTYMNGSPSVLFKEMAKDWTGWRGQKTWSDLESQIVINATMNALGHARLEIEIKGSGSDYQSLLKVDLIFHAGQLEDMAIRTSELLGN